MPQKDMQLTNMDGDREESDWPLAGLPAPLRRYQWVGAAFLARSQSALLADEMGLGKTVQAAVALKLVLRQQDAGRVLIVVPSSLVLNWLDELERWAPELVVREVTGNAGNRAALYSLPIQVLVASYDQIRIDGLGTASNEEFDIVVLDEAQRIKNAESTTALACRLLQRRRAWALTGTPLENSRSDLVAIFRFLRPGHLSYGWNKVDFHKRLAPFFLRRRKSEVLGEIPPIIVQDVRLELRSKQRDAYEDAWYGRQDFLANAGGPTTMNLLALFTRLKQLCNFEPISDESVKADYLETVLDSARGASEKVLVFSQYVQTLKWLSGHIEIDHEIYSGDLSQSEKMQVLDRFEKTKGPRVLLISLRAGGVGLNLQSAHQVILFDRWWNPAVESQAIQRAHRFGRTSPLHVHRFEVADTIEERITAILQDKEGLFEEYVNQAESGGAPTVSRAELLRILEIREDQFPEKALPKSEEQT